MSARRPPAPRLLAALLLAAALAPVGCGGTPSQDGGTPELPPHLVDPPTDAAGWLRASDLAETRRDWPAAAYCMDRAAAADADAVDASFLQRRAGLADRCGDPEAAILARRRLLELRPDDLPLRIDLADDLASTGRMAQAAEVLDRDYADAEDHRLACEALMLLYEREGQYRIAAGWAERVARDPGDRNARVWWQRASGLYERGGDIASATAAIRHALEGTDLRREEQAALDRLRAFETGEVQSVGDAIALLRFHVDAAMRLRGLQYLAAVEFDRDLETFESALRDQDLRVVEAALAALEARAPRGRTAALLPLLQHPDPAVRLAALDSLGKLGTAADVPVLLAALDPDDRAAFRGARRALERVTDHVIGSGLDPDHEERVALRAAWERWWTEQDGR